MTHCIHQSGKMSLTFLNDNFWNDLRGVYEIMLSKRRCKIRCVFNNLLIFQDIIYNIKRNFNSEFDAAYKQKEIEIARVKEKNVRIAEIISDLELEETVWQPVFEDSEKPERALVVEDDEVQASHLIPSYPILSLRRSCQPEFAHPLVCTMGSSYIRQH